MSENFQNNSGEEELSYLPPQIANKFNWGAAFFAEAWLRNTIEYSKHKKYILKKTLKFSIITYSFLTLSILILPIICIYIEETKFYSTYNFYIILLTGVLAFCTIIIRSIFWGKNGNLLAWQTKRWESFEQFNKEQRKWTMYSLLYIMIPLLIIAIAFICDLSK